MKTHAMVMTDAYFEAQTGKGLVLIDFWAPRCGPCRIQGPIIDKVAEVMVGKATVGKCNVDEEPNVAERFNVRKIPTLVVLKDNLEVERFVGLQQEPALIAAVKKHLE
jgi:thioredoxin 1